MVPDSDHRQAVCPGLESLMELDLAGQEGCAASLPDGDKRIAAAAADDAHAAGLTSGVAYDVHPLRPQPIGDVPGQLGHRPAGRSRARPAKAGQRMQRVGLDRRHMV